VKVMLNAGTNYTFIIQDAGYKIQDDGSEQAPNPVLMSNPKARFIIA